MRYFGTLKPWIWNKIRQQGKFTVNNFYDCLINGRDLILDGTFLDLIVKNKWIHIVIKVYSMYQRNRGFISSISMVQFLKTRFSRCMLYMHNAAIGTDWNIFFGISHCMLMYTNVHITARENNRGILLRLQFLIHAKYNFGNWHPTKFNKLTAMSGVEP